MEKPLEAWKRLALLKSVIMLSTVSVIRLGFKSAKRFNDFPDVSNAKKALSTLKHGNAKCVESHLYTFSHEGSQIMFAKIEQIQNSESFFLHMLLVKTTEHVYFEIVPEKVTLPPQHSGDWAGYCPRTRSRQRVKVLMQRNFRCLFSFMNQLCRLC